MNDRFEFWHDHLGVSVPDLEAAIQWYHRVLGFEVERRIQIDSIPAKVAMLKNGPLRVELFEAANGKPASEVRNIPDIDILTHGNKHVSFAADDVFALAEELKKRGADIVWVKKLPFGGCNLFMRDVAGNLIEFVQRARPTTNIASV